MADSFPALYKNDVLKAIDTIDLEKVGQAIEILKEAREQGRHIFVCGNGGSASTASHFVCDMVKGASFGRNARFRIMALTDSLPTITAYSNDVGYECVFVEQLKNFAEPGDVVLAISGFICPTSPTIGWPGVVPLMRMSTTVMRKPMPTTGSPAM